MKDHTCAWRNVYNTTRASILHEQSINHKEHNTNVVKRVQPYAPLSILRGIICEINFQFIAVKNCE